MINFLVLAALSGQPVPPPVAGLPEAMNDPRSCLTRTYDAAWLRAHRGQRLTYIRVQLDRDAAADPTRASADRDVTIGFRVRGSRQYYQTQARCRMSGGGYECSTADAQFRLDPGGQEDVRLRILTAFRVEGEGDVSPNLNAAGDRVADLTFTVPEECVA